MPDSTDYRRYLEAQFANVIATIDTLREDVRTGASGIHARLDKVNGRLDKHDVEIRALQVQQAREDGVHAMEGRLSPSRESRQAGDEEFSVRVTPKMWAALTALVGVINTILYLVFSALKDRGIGP